MMFVLCTDYRFVLAHMRCRLCPGFCLEKPLVGIRSRQFDLLGTGFWHMTCMLMLGTDFETSLAGSRNRMWTRCWAGTFRVNTQHRLRLVKLWCMPLADRTDKMKILAYSDRSQGRMRGSLFHSPFWSCFGIFLQHKLGMLRWVCPDMFLSNTRCNMRNLCRTCIGLKDIGCTLWPQSNRNRSRVGRDHNWLSCSWPGTSPRHIWYNSVWLSLVYTTLPDMLCNWIFLSYLGMFHFDRSCKKMPV